MVSLSTRPWSKPSWASRMPKAPVQNIMLFFLKEMQMHRRCIRYLKYLGFSLKKSTVLCNNDHFLHSTCRLANQTCPALFIPTSHFGLETSHGLYPRRPCREADEIYMGFCQAFEISVCVCSRVHDNEDVWNGTHLVPYLHQSIYYLYLTDNLWIYPIGNFCESSFGKKTSSLSKK